MAQSPPKRTRFLSFFSQAFRFLTAVTLPLTASLLAAVAPIQANAGNNGAKQRPASMATSTASEASSFYYAEHPAAMAFANDLAQRRDLDLTWVRRQIGQTEHLPRIDRKSVV